MCMIIYGLSGNADLDGLSYSRRGRVNVFQIFYLTTDSIHFIYRYMALDIGLQTTWIMKKETRCRHYMG